MSARDVIARAIEPLPKTHGQLCPVAKRSAALEDCDCWVKGGVYVRAERAVSMLRAAGYLRPDAD